MRTFKTTGPLVALTLLATCASNPSTSQVQTLITTMKRDPAQAWAFTIACNKGQVTNDERVAGSLLMRVPPSDVIPVFCRRLVWAMINDKITAQQVADVVRGVNLAPVMMAVAPIE